MLVKTQALIISSIKYGDHSKIVKCFTQSEGVRSFMVKNVNAKNNKLNAIISPLNWVEFIYQNKNNSNLTLLKSGSIVHHYQTIYSDPIKISISLFLAEILNHVLKEESSNEKLFDFLIESLVRFDSKSEEFADFHLYFLLALTRYLGFYPQISTDAKYFDLLNGVSSDQMISGFAIEKERLELFKELSKINFSDDYKSNFNRSKRKILLETLIQYYELHIDDFKRPNSLEVLYQVFG